MKKIICAVAVISLLIASCASKDLATIGKCELKVTCESVFEGDKLTDDKRAVIPEDGIIFLGLAEIKEGDTAFDVLKRTMQDEKIHIEFSSSPAYNVIYVEGISNLYQQDLGEMSGWLYRVNGESPDVAMSAYKVSDGDRIEVYYSCNFMEEM